MKHVLLFFCCAAVNLVAEQAPRDDTWLRFPEEVPPEEWTQFEAEMKALEKLEHPRLEDIRRVQEKWFARWGILEQIEKHRAETTVLKIKYRFMPDPTVKDNPSSPGFVDRNERFGDPVMEWSTDPRIFDPEGWRVQWERDESEQITATLRLKPEHYDGYTPEDVHVFLRSGEAAMPSPSNMRGPYEVFIPLAVEELGSNTYRVRLSLSEALRGGLVLQAEAKMEARWVAYGGFTLPMDSAPAGTENGVRILPNNQE